MRPAAAAAVLSVVLGAAPAVATPPAPLEEARRATEQTSFAGILEVRWADGAVARSEKLAVQASDSTLALHGGNRVVAWEPFERLVSHRGHPWEELRLAPTGASERPDGAGKYEVVSLPEGPVVAGRPTTTVEIRQAGALRDRLHLDTTTKLPLKREQFDDRGAVTRSLAFETVTVGATDPPAHPRAVRSRTAKAVSVGSAAGASVPDGLADGYRRRGVYRAAGVLHVLYSDGIYDLSVFEQVGRLRTSDLPGSGEPVAVGSATGRRYVWPGGHVVVWASGGMVLTAVSDAPLDQVLQAVRSMPPARDPAPSLLGKLRRACKALMEPLS